MQNLIFAAQQSKGDTMLVTTITGMLIVFAALILLIFIIWLFGKAFSGVKKAEKIESKPAKSTAAPVVLPTATPAAQSNDDIIAVIAAAVAVYGESQGKKFAVRSVKKAANMGGRSAWAAAGIAENVRSF